MSRSFWLKVEGLKIDRECIGDSRSLKRGNNHQIVVSEALKQLTPPLKMDIVNVISSKIEREMER